MIDRKTAGKLVMKFSGLDFFPGAREGQEMLVDAMEKAVDEYVASRQTQRWIERNPKAPTPSDILAMVQPESEDSVIKPTRCHDCGDTGFRTIWQLIEYTGDRFSHKDIHEVSEDRARELLASCDGIRQRVQSAAKRCECRKVAV